jgi:cholesterol transport system auxiliary component
MIKTIQKLALLGVLMSLGGCVSLLLGVEETPPRFTLAPVSFPNTNAEPLPLRLVISDPRAERAFRTSSITRSPDALRYEYYAGAEWSDRAPRLFGIFLQRSFENSGRIGAVGDRTSLPLGDFTLHTDIRSFHVSYLGGRKVAKISYFARLTDNRNKTIDTQLFSAEEPVRGDGVEQAVQAMNRAANRAGDATVNWTLNLMTQ